MKFKYDLDRIIMALDYYDIKGLIKLMDNEYFVTGEPSLSEMEEVFKTKFLELDREKKKLVESYMLSCARENSTIQN